MNITRRKSTEDDFEFVFQLNKTNMKKYVDQLRGWDEDFERRDMRQKFTVGVDEIIQVDGRDIGVFRVTENNEEIILEHIEIAPEFQGKDIGTHLIQKLIQKAKYAGKRLRTQTLKTNPALNFYKKHGFEIVAEDELKCILIYRGE